MSSGSKREGRTPSDILEAAGVRLLDEEALKDWPPKPEEDGEGGASFLFFTAPWCEVSLEAAPRFGKLFEEFSARADFCQVDADRAPLGTERLGVRSVPAVVAFARGQEVSRRVGLAAWDDLKRLVEEALAEAEAGTDNERE